MALRRLAIFVLAMSIAGTAQASPAGLAGRCAYAAAAREIQCDLRLTKPGKLTDLSVAWANGRKASGANYSPHAGSSRRTDLLLLLDRSAAKNKRVLRAAARDLARQVREIDRPGVRIGLAAISDKFEQLAQLGTKADDIAARLESVQPKGAFRSLPAAISQALDGLAKSEVARRGLLVVSFGRMGPAKADLAREIRSMRGYGIVIYGLVLPRPGASAQLRTFLADLSDATEGHFVEVLGPNPKIPPDAVTTYLDALTSGGRIVVPLAHTFGRQRLNFTGRLANGGTVRLQVPIDIPRPGADKDFEGKAWYALERAPVLVATFAGVALLALLATISAMLYRGLMGRARRKARAAGDGRDAGSGAAPSDAPAAHAIGLAQPCDRPSDAAGTRGAGALQEADRAKAPTPAPASENIASPNIAGPNIADAKIAGPNVADQAKLQAPSEGARLELLGDAGGVFAISTATARIGRHQENDIRLNNRTVHRYHATLARDADGRVIVTDISGRNGNGVIVNGSRVAHAILTDGDRIELGEAVLRFRAADGTSADEDDRD